MDDEVREAIENARSGEPARNTWSKPGRDIPFARAARLVHDTLIELQHRTIEEIVDELSNNRNQGGYR